MCRACGNLIGADSDECTYCGRTDRVTAGLLGDPMRLFGAFGPMKVVTGANIVVFAVMVLLARIQRQPMGAPVPDFLGFPGLYDFATFVRSGGLIPPLVSLGEVWRLVTACFIHLGIVHLAMNSLALVQLGPTTEELYGRSKTLVIYVLSGIGGSIAAQLFNMGGAGASGAIYGLIGSYLAYALRVRSHMSEALKAYVIQSVMYGIAMGIMAHVNNAAHAGGFVAGVVAGYVLTPGEPARKFESRLVTTLAWVSIGVVIASFVAVVVTFGRY